jgi:hypothetical protein
MYIRSYIIMDITSSSARGEPGKDSALYSLYWVLSFYFRGVVRHDHECIIMYNEIMHGHGI